MLIRLKYIRNFVLRMVQAAEKRTVNDVSKNY